METHVRVGQTIGIIGGGQLGRMLAVAASRLGLKSHIFSAVDHPPAADVAHAVTIAEYTDRAALTAFAKSVAVVTFEFENIPAEALDIIEESCRVLPRRNALATSQDRWTEKQFLTGLGLKVAPFANVESPEDFAHAIGTVGVPSILKTRRLGYDGKGQIRLKTAADLADAWSKLGCVPCVLEGFVSFRSEVSVIAARSAAGKLAYFDPGENVHRDGILHTTTVPARLSKSEHAEALTIASKILGGLEYVGVMGVELFVTAKGLLVNEIAPRVHNSGHWTQNGCTVDQFEQHIRAVAGLPLGSGARHSNVTMTNLIGDEATDLEKLCRDADTALHLYGKPEARPGRKMGHVNRVTQTVGE